MRKVIGIIIALLMIFSLVACSGGGDKTAPAQSSSQSENVAQSVVPEVKTEGAAAETEKNKTEETASSEPEVEEEVKEEQPSNNDLGGYGGPGNELVGYGGPGNELVGYGGPGEFTAESGAEAACSLRFADEETIYQNEIKRICTTDGVDGEVKVYSCPVGTKIVAEIYGDNVVIESCINKHIEDIYYNAGDVRRLSGDDEWSDDNHQFNSGEQYQITLNEAGLWLFTIVDGDYNLSHAFYEVNE